MKKLLPWQIEALDKFKEATKPEFILIAGTGCGKTTAGAHMAHHAYATHMGAKKPLIVVFCPYRSIKRGWRDAFNSLGLFTAIKTQDIAEDKDVIVTTYAGAGQTLNSIDKLIKRRSMIFIFDEFHHLEENNTWAAPFLDTKYTYERAIFLSGTPWREKGEFPGNLIPYDAEEDKVIHDHEHTYGHNVNLFVKDGKNTTSVRFRPLSMEVTVERLNTDGAVVGSDLIKTSETNRSDSIAPFVRFDGLVNLVENRPQLCGMLDRAVCELSTMRKSGAMPNAAGIVFVSGKREGEAVRQYLIDKHEKPAVFVTSDDALAHKTIDDFRHSWDEWIIAIDMIAEGTDIPRLNVAVDLSYKMTLMHIIQRWGRVLRLLRNADGSLDKNTEAAIFYIDHAQLRHVAEKIETDIKRNRRKTDVDKEGGEPPKPTTLKVVNESGEYLKTIFKGKAIEEQQYELASWLVAENYGGVVAEMGYAIALQMAQMFIASSTVPDEFFIQKPKEPEFEFEISKEAQFQDAVDKYTGLTAKIAIDFLDSDFSTAARYVNQRMGVREFSRKNATLAQVMTRVEAAEAVYQRLVAKHEAAE